MTSLPLHIWALARPYIACFVSLYTGKNHSRFTHNHILLLARLTTATFQTALRAMTSRHTITSPHKQQIYKLKRLGRDAGAACAPFRIIERQASRPLSRRFFGCEFFQCVLALCPHVAGHADDELRHQA